MTPPLDPSTRFDLDHSEVSILAKGAFDGTSQERFHEWNKSPHRLRSKTVEYLLPRIHRDIVREWPEALQPADASEPTHDPDDTRRTQAHIDSTGPWHLPFPVEHGVTTWRGLAANTARKRVLFRRDLILGTLTDLLGDELAESTVLDIGCNMGFFSLDLAARGARQVDGVDLRPENIARADYLRSVYGIDNVSFRVADVDEFQPGRQWDVVLNLGVLYHVTRPVEFIELTHRLCRRVAILDTVTVPEPFSGFTLMSDKDIDAPEEGRERVELHPTYRGAIDLLRHAGFEQIVEVVGHADEDHKLYAAGRRRCFIAIR